MAAFETFCWVNLWRGGVWGGVFFFFFLSRQHEKNEKKRKKKGWYIWIWWGLKVGGDWR